jgi:hypothetical protein
LEDDAVDMAAERATLVAIIAALESPVRAADLAAIETDLVVRVARHHRLSPLLSATSADRLPPVLASTLRRDRLATVGRNLMLAQVAEECVDALSAAGISTVVLKGLAYERSLYAAAGAGTRPTSDVDLLVKAEHRRAAFSILDDLGFEPRAAAPGFDDADYHEVAWTRLGVEVDLHLGLAPIARCSIDYENVWSRVTPVTGDHTKALALDPVHAAVFHTLHMAIDHFDVPAIYLIDLARILITPEDILEAAATARSWRCYRPFATATALAAAFLPEWGRTHRLRPTPVRSARIIAQYGSTTRLSRPKQIVRKLTHFDTIADTGRYIAVQASRNVREIFERRLRKRSPRERLSLNS